MVGDLVSLKERKAAPGIVSIADVLMLRVD